MGIQSILARITPEMIDEHWGAAAGTEHELGVINPTGGSDFKSERLPDGEFVTSGARIYEDMDHPEMSTAEASNPLQLVAIERALTLRMLELKLGGTLYKNCVDFRGGIEKNNTFGAHENYFTSARRLELDALIPFLVSRIIYTGAGDTSHGKEELYLSQRAPYIVALRGAQTLGNRPLLNERNEPLSDVPGWIRLHLIPNDGNVSQIASLLKGGTMMLLLRLIETGKLDPLPYDESKAIEDLHSINRLNADWVLKGTKPLPMRAVDVQAHFLNQVVAKLPNPSPLEQVVIDLWAEMLTVLSTDPMQATGAVDWVTKLNLFEWLREHETSKTPFSAFQSADLEYHNIDPKRGIFFGLEEAGMAYRIVSDDQVQRFVHDPPQTTRAWFRGNALKLAEESKKRGNTHVRVDADWEWVNLYVDGSLREDLSFHLADPRISYEEKLGALRTKLGL